MRARLFLLLALAFALHASAFSELRLPHIFTSNMVLQQKTNAPIWGWDVPGSKVVISTTWGVHAVAETGPDGGWHVALRTPGAGGPHTVTVAGSTVATLRDVLIGEVWLCSGQSNMQMSMPPDNPDWRTADFP